MKQIIRAILPTQPLIICIMFASVFSRVRNAASSEQVKNIAKKVLKIFAVIGGVLLVYKFGKSMGKSGEQLKVQDALCEKAMERFGPKVGVRTPDGSMLDLEDALIDIDASKIIRDLVSPEDVLRIAKENAAVKW